jgi:predicted nucleic acid-binding protein
VTNLYLDMNIYNRPFDDQSQMRIRLETVAITMIFTLIESGHFSTRWSFVLEYENSRNPFPERRAYVHYLAQSCDSTIEPDEPIRELAKQLSERHKIRGRDALHLACAELSGCHYLVTCDDLLIRQGERLREKGILTLRVINPIDLLREV